MAESSQDLRPNYGRSPSPLTSLTPSVHSMDGLDGAEAHCKRSGHSVHHSGGLVYKDRLPPVHSLSLCSIYQLPFDSWLTLNCDLCIVLQTFSLQNHHDRLPTSLRTNCVLSSHSREKSIRNILNTPKSLEDRIYFPQLFHQHHHVFSCWLYSRLPR